MSWSPDGQKLAAIRTFTDRVAAGGIFVYSLEIQNLQMIVDKAAGARWLNEGRFNQQFLPWQRLFSSQSCSSDQLGCELSPESGSGFVGDAQ